MASKKTGRDRLSVDLNKQERKTIDAMKARDGDSYTVIVRKAISLYGAVTTHMKAGGRLVFRKPNGKEEVVLVVISA